MNPRLNIWCETPEFLHVKKTQFHKSAMAQLASKEENYLLWEVLGFMVYSYSEMHLMVSFFLQI